jgi:hypothetical protein
MRKYRSTPGNSRNEIAILEVFIVDGEPPVEKGTTLEEDMVFGLWLRRHFFDANFFLVQGKL